MRSVTVPKGFVLLQEERIETTNSGIVLVRQSAAEETSAFVVQLGIGEYPYGVNVGDKVIYNAKSITKIELGQDKLFFIKEEDILAVFE